jgi:NAD(P)-dependent dehydrogenase (short-subunit alcohol dehydrogenase family)
MKQKNVIITGITSGIGTEIALDLAKNGHKINLVARSEESGNIIKDMIIKKTKNNDIQVYRCDLSLQKDIREFVDNFKKQNDSLDILINNAGIIPKERIITSEGIETQFAVNYIAPYLLSRLLLDILKKSSPSRIVNTSSTAHTSGNLNVDDFQRLNEKYALRGWRAYFDTKLALTIDTVELAKELEGTGVTCNAIHPGFVSTNLGRYMTPKFMRPMNKIMGMFILSPKGGADPIIEAALSDKYENVSGQYFHRFKQKDASKKVFDKDVIAKLSEYTKSIVA